MSKDSVSINKIEKYTRNDFETMFQTICKTKHVVTDN